MNLIVNIFNSFVKIIVFVCAYFKASYYNLIQNITGKKVYKWQKYSAEFKQKYEDIPQNKMLFTLISLIVAIILLILYLIFY